MLSRLRNFRLLPLLAGIVLPASANTAIPGSFMFFASGMTFAPWQWMVACMLMCILVEGAVYRFSGRYRRPFFASAYANIASFIVGIPLTLLAALDPTWFILPTAASIFVEFGAILLARKYLLVGGARPEFLPIFWGNVLTNLIMLGYLLLLMAIRYSSPIEYIGSRF